jgi:hypothetical protein
MKHFEISDYERQYYMHGMHSARIVKLNPNFEPLNTSVNHSLKAGAVGLRVHWFVLFIFSLDRGSFLPLAC